MRFLGAEMLFKRKILSGIQASLYIFLLIHNYATVSTLVFVELFWFQATNLMIAVSDIGFIIRISIDIKTLVAS